MAKSLENGEEDRLWHLRQCTPTCCKVCFVSHAIDDEQYLGQPRLPSLSSGVRRDLVTSMVAATDVGSRQHGQLFSIKNI